ncbi:MAG: hypothetical protein K2M17_03625 [Bacilli bacterium]|nr:hypothetical protein [Bacilli bacterium]
MKKKTKLSILGCAIIIILVILVSRITTKIPTAEIKKELETKKFLDTKIAEVNDLNAIFQKKNLTEEGSFAQNNGNTCYKYIGENKEVYIAKIKAVYVNPFLGYSNFNLVNNNQSNDLYACLPQDCQVKNIKNYEITEQTETSINVMIENTSYEMGKVNGEFRFIYPILVCEG